LGFQATMRPMGWTAGLLSLMRGAVDQSLIGTCLADDRKRKARCLPAFSPSQGLRAKDRFMPALNQGGKTV
jgi:hypothetical protein